MVYGDRDIYTFKPILSGTAKSCTVILTNDMRFLGPLLQYFLDPGEEPIRAGTIQDTVVEDEG